MANGKVFCAYPYVSLFVSNSGKQLPCCYAQNNHFSEMRAPNIQKSNSTTNLWNSEYIRFIRSMMSEGKFPAACQGCEKTEALRGESHRQRSLKQFVSEIESVDVKDSYVTSPIRHLDLRLGNKCNLACRMCHPASSNQLIPEWLMSDDEEERVEAQDVLIQPQWRRSSRAIELLNSDVVDPTFIHFAGGEPSIDKRHEKILEHLIAQKKSQSVTVSYNTNLTKKLSTLKWINHFKKFKITVSIDGVGKMNDYIRAPSQWSLIDKQMREYVDLSNQSDKIQLEANVTLSAYNILYIKDILLYFSQLPKSMPLVPVFTVVEDPSWLSFSVLPLELRSQVISMIQSLDSIYLDFDSQTLLKERLSSLLSDLNSKKWNPDLFAKFCAKTKFFDQHRNVSLGELSPEWIPYFAQELIGASVGKINAEVLSR